jgi:hypothetical protein
MRVSECKKALFISYVSYMAILFAIIVVDTFHNKDFDFRRAAMISGVFVTALTCYFILMFVVFKLRIDQC